MQKLVKVGRINLTAREIRIIKLICKQLTNREIGDQLGISKRTIEDLRLEINRKTKSKNTVGIVVFALRNGLFSI